MARGTRNSTSSASKKAAQKVYFCKVESPRIVATAIGGFVFGSDEPIELPSGKIVLPPTQEELAELYRRPGFDVIIGVKEEASQGEETENNEDEQPEKTEE